MGRRRSGAVSVIVKPMEKEREAEDGEGEDGEGEDGGEVEEDARLEESKKNYEPKGDFVGGRGILRNLGRGKMLEEEGEEE